MPRQFQSKESVKKILTHAESKVMQGCFDCGKCGDCNKFIEIENKCKAKGLLAFKHMLRIGELCIEEEISTLK